MHLFEMDKIFDELIIKYLKNIEEDNIKIFKILHVDDSTIYYLDFILDQATSYDSTELNGSHLNLIIDQFKQNIEHMRIINKTSSELIITYNINKEISYKIKIQIHKMDKDSEFVYFGKSASAEITRKATEKEYRQKAKVKNKIMRLMKEYKVMSLTDISNETRSLKDCEARRDILQELVNEKQIINKIEKVGKKDKCMYFLNEEN